MTKPHCNNRFATPKRKGKDERQQIRDAYASTQMRKSTRLVRQSHEVE